MEKENIKVCYFGTYRSEYSRNRIMIKGLRKNDVDVIECHEALWTGIEDRIEAVKGGWNDPKFLLRVFRTYLKLIKKYKKIKNYDVMVIGYPGQFDVFLGRLLTWIKKKPLVWDVFMSIYLISIERELDKQSRFSVKLLKFFESFALRLPNRLILDTKQYSQWFENVYKIPAKKFSLVPTGADDDVFSPSFLKEKERNEKFEVLYYGTFIPNHGVSYIIKAANELKGDPEIIFILVGEGPDLQSCRDLVEQHHLENVQFIPWIEQKKLKDYIQNADIVLGAFGKTPQSLMTVQNKIYEGMALKKLVITGDSEAVRDSFKDGVDIILCDRNNPQNLAKAISNLKDDRELIQMISEKAYSKFSQEFTIYNNGKKFTSVLEKLSR